MRPARLLRHPEHVLGQILVRVFGSGGVFRQQRRALRLEGVGDVLEEDQAERDVLVVGRLEVLAQLVGGEEQLRLEAEIGSVAVRLLRLGRLGGSWCRRPAFFLVRPFGMMVPWLLCDATHGLRS